MPKKYGKNMVVLRGHVKLLGTQSLEDGTLIVKATINIPGREDKTKRVPIEAFGDTGEELKKHDGEWIEVEGIVKGREYDSRWFLSAQIFEVKTLPMHKEEKAEPSPEPPPEEEDVPF